MKYLLVALAFLLLLSVLACKDDDSDKVKELEARIRSLEDRVWGNSPQGGQSTVDTRLSRLERRVFGQLPGGLSREVSELQRLLGLPITIPWDLTVPEGTVPEGIELR